MQFVNQLVRTRGFKHASKLQRFSSQANSKYPTGVFINGEFIDIQSKLGVVNPSTGETIADVCLGGKEEIDQAVAAAKAAWNGPWRDLPTSERAALLRKVAENLVRNKMKLQKSLFWKMG